MSWVVPRTRTSRTSRTRRRSHRSGLPTSSVSPTSDRPASIAPQSKGTTLSEYTYDFTVAEAMTEEMSTITGQIGTWLADLDRDIVSTLQDRSSDARTAYDEAQRSGERAGG